MNATQFFQSCVVDMEISFEIRFVSLSHVVLLDQKVICNINENGQKVILVPFLFVIMTRLQPLGATCSIAKYQRVILGKTGCYAPEWWDMDVSDLLDK